MLELAKRHPAGGSRQNGKAKRGANLHVSVVSSDNHIVAPLCGRGVSD
jgi:hypothetical protein